MDYCGVLRPCQGRPIGLVNFAYVFVVVINPCAKAFADNEGARYVLYDLHFEGAVFNFFYGLQSRIGATDQTFNRISR